MAETRPTLLLTRPEAGSSRFACAFRARFGADWPVVIAPLMQTRWLQAPLDLAGCDGLVFTSETAVRAFARLTDRRDLPAWCVGIRTADAAATAGFRAITGPGDALGLASLLADRAQGQCLIWPRGLDMAQDLCALTQPDGPRITPAIVYAQDALPLRAEARACLAHTAPLLVPLFSPRSARLFAKAAGRPVAPLLMAAISPAVADVARVLDPERLVTATHADGESLLDALATLSQPFSAG